MTGQGNRSHELIRKAAIQTAGDLNLHKTYRTRGDHRTRALTITFTTKIVLDGKIVDGPHRRVIIGQVLMTPADQAMGYLTTEWAEQIWELNGKNLLTPVLDLVEHKEKTPTQLQLI